MNAPPQTDGLIEFDDTPPQAEFIFCSLKFWNCCETNIPFSKLIAEINLQRLNHHQNWNQWQQTNRFVQKCLNNGPLIETLLVSRTVFRHLVKQQWWIWAANSDFGLKCELCLSETVKSVNKELNWIHSVEHFVWIKVTCLFLDLFKLPNVVVATSDSL